MTGESLELEWIAGEYQILRFAADFELPNEVYTSPIITLSRTEDETSILLPTEQAIKFDTSTSPSPLVGFRISGTLDHNLVGILANISNILADAKIPIFAISTFDTDYIYVPTKRRTNTQAALESNGYFFKQNLINS